MFRIRIRSDPKLFAGSGSGVGSGINHFESESGQPLPCMNLKQNFSDRNHTFSTKYTIKMNKNLFFSKNISLKNLSDKIWNSVEAETSVAGSETGSGAETSFQVGSGFGSETNHSGSTTLLVSPPSTLDYFESKDVRSGSFLNKKFFSNRIQTCYPGMCIRFQFIRTVSSTGTWLWIQILSGKDVLKAVVYIKKCEIVFFLHYF